MALLRHTNTFFMQRPPIIPTLLVCLVTTVIYKYNNVNYALFLCSLGRLTHCRSQFSLFLPVLRFASSATGGAQLRTSPAARRISHGAAIFHIAKAIFHPFVRTDFTARKRAYSIPSSAVSIASSVFPSFAVSAAANCAFSGWHRALRL